MTSPSLPRSLPVRTRTRSPFFIFMTETSQHFRCERDDSHELLVAQLTADRAEDARAARLLLVVDQHRGVLVEADVAAVRPPLLLLGPDDDAFDDVALLYSRTRDGVLHRGDEDVADRRVPPLGAAQHLDAEHLLGAAVVGHPEPRFLLDHHATFIGPAPLSRSASSGRCAPALRSGARSSGPLQDLDDAP